MEKKHKPNSHECLRQDPSSSWSELPVDLLSSVFKRLSFANFKRAKSVCSSWYSASRKSVPKSHIPWLILFPEQNNNNNNNCCMLFNPEEKHKFYKTRDLGLEFAKSVCLATYGNWLLMQDPRYNLYIVNLVTQERINLPPVEAQLGTTKIERTIHNYFVATIFENWEESIAISIRYPVFWIDEKTKDYVVLWELENLCVVYSKKGETSWNQIPETWGCFDLVYKDHKLYFLCRSGFFKIFDFSGESPHETFICDVVVNGFELGRQLQPSNLFRVTATKLVVTVTGDVLKVEKVVRPPSRVSSFRLYKLYSSGFLKPPEQIDSLGDEAMLFDLGITVLANGLEGFKRNSIYFNSSYRQFPNKIVLFNLQTQKKEQLHKFDRSSVQLSSAQWFLPSFTQTID